MNKTTSKHTNMTLCEKEEYRGCTINVYYDPDADDPRSWSNVATFVCEHRDYMLGDEHCIQDAVNELFSSYVSSKAIIEYFIKSRGVKLIPGEENDDCDQYYEYETTYRGETYKHYIDADTSLDDDKIASQMEDELGLDEKLQLVEETGEVVILPISMYEHSGITLWLGSKWSHCDAQWDCSSIGFAYVEKSTAKNEGMLDPGETWHNDWKEWAYAMMKGEMTTYDQFVRGEVYGYMIEDEEGEEAADNLLCGCWGYYDKDDLLEEAKANADAYLNEKRETRKDNLETLKANLASMFGITFTDGAYLYRIARDMFGYEYIERAKISKSVVGTYVQINLSDLDDEILGDMVEEIKDKTA